MAKMGIDDRPLSIDCPFFRVGVTKESEENGIMIPPAKRKTPTILFTDKDTFLSQEEYLFALENNKLFSPFLERAAL